MKELATDRLQLRQLLRTFKCVIILNSNLTIGMVIKSHILKLKPDGNCRETLRWCNTEKQIIPHFAILNLGIFYCNIWLLVEKSYRTMWNSVWCSSCICRALEKKRGGSEHIWSPHYAYYITNDGVNWPSLPLSTLLDACETHAWFVCTTRCVKTDRRSPL